MGAIYCGPYADEIGYDDHEGYAARILPDGTETGTLTYETRAFRSYRAHCTCGWRGTARYPATDSGEDAALDEWDHDHLQPLIRAEAARHTISAASLLELISELRASLQFIADPAADGGQRLTARSLGVCDAIDRLHEFLDRQRGQR